MKNRTVISILLIIMVWYIADIHFFFSGLPFLLIPIQKLVFLKEKVLKMASFSWRWNPDTLGQEQPFSLEKSKIITSIYSLGLWQGDRLKNHYIQDDGNFFTSAHKDQDGFFVKIFNRKMFINSSGERVIEQWSCVGKRFPFAIQHAYVIIPFHVPGITQPENNNYSMERSGEI